jgi:hypothetical protein
MCPLQATWRRNCEFDMPSSPPLQFDYTPDRERLKVGPDREWHGSSGRVITTIILTLLLTAAHLWYTHTVVPALGERSGGMTMGGINLAPAVPLHLPAGMVFYTGLKLRGLDGYRKNHVPEGAGRNRVDAAREMVMLHNVT